MTSHGSGRIAEALAHRVEEGAEAAHIADAIVSLWQQINVALSPIMGQGSVAVLYVRSLHIIRAAHPWLEATHEEIHKPMDLVSLRGVLAQRTSTEAATAGGALVQTFYELLASLIGPALTEQLLRAVWENFLSGPPAQDSLP